MVASYMAILFHALNCELNCYILSTRRAPWFSDKSQVRSFMAKAFDPLSVVLSAVDFIYGES